MQYIHLVLIAMLLNVLLKVDFVGCIKCYQCRSDEEPECDLVPLNAAFLKECTEKSLIYVESSAKQNQAWCRKIVQSLLVGGKNKKQVMIRECARVYQNETCYKAPYPATNYQLTCDCSSTGCNKAPRTVFKPFSDLFRAVIIIVTHFLLK